MSESIPQVRSVLPYDAAPRYELVILAASAGGLQAVQTILAALPRTFPTPIVVLQHRSPTAPSVLSTLLGRRSALPVKDAESGERFSPGTVYVAPATSHLLVQDDGCFRFVDGRRVNFLRAAADPLIRSAAHALKGRVIAAILTGGGRNGTDAVRDVRALGGTVIAQDPATAYCNGMPRAAIATGAVDYVLSLEKIGPMLVRLTGSAPNDSLRNARPMAIRRTCRGIVCEHVAPRHAGVRSRMPHHQNHQEEL
jgi:two-component system chemotaxis response regulator CheB